jgi:nitroreductase
VFSGEGLRYFSELHTRLYKQYAGSSFKETKYQKLLDYPLMSSHVISIGMKRDESNRLPEVEEIEAVACAVQNMYLTITAYGLGCYWSTSGITYFEEAKPYFGLGGKDRLLGFFYIGYVAVPPDGPSKRNPVQDKVRWVGEYPEADNK